MPPLLYDRRSRAIQDVACIVGLRKKNYKKGMTLELIGLTRDEARITKGGELEPLHWR